MTSNPFAPATREQLKGRVALDGPTGSGKTWTALAMAAAMAEAEGKKFAVVDTERRSASLYSDRFTFDTLPWLPPYDPRKLAEVLFNADQSEEYAVFVTDSLTHFWKGKGGVMDIVDGAARRNGGGNQFSGWKEGTPALQTLIDTMLGLNSHFIGTMRSKMEHLLVENERGRMVPQKVGMAPEMRGDIEYEFTLCISMDLGHTGVVTKSRCEELADLVIPAGITNIQEVTDRFLTWLREGAPAPELIAEAERARLVNWANGLAPALRGELRNLWPIGVPQLRDPALTAVQAGRIEAVLTSLAPEGESGADDEGQGDDEGATADENGDPIPAKANGAAKKAPAKKAAAEKKATSAKKSAQARAAEHAGRPDLAVVEGGGEGGPDEADPEPGVQEPPAEPGTEEVPTADEAPAEDAPAAADAPEGTEGADDGSDAADGESAADGDVIDWKAEAKSIGVTPGMALRAARDLAAELGLPLPPSLASMTDTTEEFRSALFTRLTNIAEAEAARQVAE